MSEMEPTPPLEYRAPRDDAKERAQPIGQQVVGAVIASVMVFVAVFFMILGLLDFRGGGPRADRLPIILYSSAPMALLALITLYQHFVRHRRWFFQGVLIGIGVAALIEGACFAILK